MEQNKGHRPSNLRALIGATVAMAPLALVAAPASAQEQEIIVTAQKREQALRDLHPKIIGGGSGAGVQLAPRSARGLRSLHTLPEARRLDGFADVL